MRPAARKAGAQKMEVLRHAQRQPPADQVQLGGIRPPGPGRLQPMESRPRTIRPSQNEDLDTAFSLPYLGGEPNAPAGCDKLITHNPPLGARPNENIPAMKRP